MNSDCEVISMISASNLGYPRIGSKRQLKTALENFWNGKCTEEELLHVGKELRLSAWNFQLESGIDFIPSNDFSFYDHVLDTIAMVGAVPKRFQWSGDKVDLTTYFLMARGTIKSPKSNGCSIEAPAMEMTKWFNTNYHFIVPELEDNQHFKLASRKCIDEFSEAQAAGVNTRPVLLGPMSFLYLAKGHQPGKDIAQLERLIEVYRQVFSELRQAGAKWIQMDEPCLSMDLNERVRAGYRYAYEKLAEENLSVLLTTYFSYMGRNLPLALDLPVQGIHLDLINGMQDLQPALSNLPSHMLLSAGVVDGHNVWRCNLQKTINLLGNIAEEIGPDRLIVAPSCSLIHVPLDVDVEAGINPEVSSLLSFARQKVKEISVITDGLCCGLKEVDDIVRENNKLFENISARQVRHNPTVESRLGSITPRMFERETKFSQRIKLQQKLLNLPLLPTTTIGSFPQTKEIREARKRFRSGKIDSAQYVQAMKNEIANNIQLQEKIGLDVLVHGEPERTDMVEYFAEMLDGMVVTQHGWVQSYGSRYVKPPIIYGPVSRPSPVTVEWARYAQGLTIKPVKGMLTGPVTILQWSFVRDDQPREKTCTELALAIRDEVCDLESAGIKIIQIDEPAIREGLPLKRTEWDDYLRWSVNCFRLTGSGVADDTQIHTHMCYSEFGDMVQSIAEMDADVISIEAARSNMDLLETLKEIRYSNAIGPGVYDIHSPRVPSEDEIDHLLRKALTVIPVERLWVNPDCGLKTRNWEEVVPALNALVQSALRLRSDARCSAVSISQL
jgi:5-methyltetrahydropteroyltriglutamate--homocysteine methyltransferase